MQNWCQLSDILHNIYPKSQVYFANNSLLPSSVGYQWSPITFTERMTSLKMADETPQHFECYVSVPYIRDQSDLYHHSLHLQMPQRLLVLGQQQAACWLQSYTLNFCMKFLVKLMIPNHHFSTRWCHRVSRCYLQIILTIQVTEINVPYVGRIELIVVWWRYMASWNMVNTSSSNGMACFLAVSRRIIVNWTRMNKFSLNCYLNTVISIQEKKWNVVCTTSTILFGPQGVKRLMNKYNHSTRHTAINKIGPYLKLIFVIPDISDETAALVPITIYFYSIQLTVPPHMHSKKWTTLSTPFEQHFIQIHHFIEHIWCWWNVGVKRQSVAQNVSKIRSFFQSTERDIFYQTKNWLPSPF